MPQPNTSNPAFGKAPSHISDVQLRHSLSPDSKANTILFDNFQIRLLPGGPPIETRTLSIVFPLTGVEAATPLVVNLRGSVALDTGTRATLAFRVLGVTHVLDPLLGPGEANPGDFFKELRLDVPPGADLRMSIIMALEREGPDQTTQALLSLDSIDMALAPQDAKK